MRSPRSWNTLADLLPVARAADPADKAQIYAQLGLPLTYHPQDGRSEPRPRHVSRAAPQAFRMCPAGVFAVEGRS